MGCKSSTNHGSTVFEVKQSQPGTWGFKDLDFIGEPPLQLHSGPISFDQDDGRGHCVQYGGRTPEQQMRHLLQHEAESYATLIAQGGQPAAATKEYSHPMKEEDAINFLQRVSTNKSKIWNGGRICPSVNKGIKGSSPLHVASMPWGDEDDYNHTLFFCLEEGIGFGIVREADWADLWFVVWCMRQREAHAERKQMLVLTEEDGSAHFNQSIEVLWLKKEGISFKSMRAKSFLLQGRPLLQAVKQEKEEVAEYLLRSELAPKLLEQRGFNGFMPIHALAAHGHTHVLAMFLERGKVGRDAPTFDGMRPLHLASREGHKETVRQLLAAHASVDAVADDGSTALWQASGRSGHETAVWRLLAAKASANKTASNGTSPLLMASHYGHEVAVRLLLSARADVEAKMEACGATPLLAASVQGHEASVRQLLSALAEPDRTSAGVTPLLMASQEGHEAGVRMLLAARASPDLAREEDKVTPLLMASQKGREQVLKLLLAARAAVERAAEGRTPLFMACKNGHAEAVRELLKEGAQPNLRVDGGRSALEAARRWGGDTVLQLLLTATSK